jgi:ABC-type glutathione transport system ATPase component
MSASRLRPARWSSSPATRRRQDDAGQADRLHRAADRRQSGGQRPEPRRFAAQRDSLFAPQLRHGLSGPEAAVRPQRARQRLLPLQIVGLPRREAIRRAQAALDKVGLLSREKAMPIAISGGEQQRLAIARAVVNRPTVLLADEPTGNLDSESATEILEIFSAFHQVGVTVVIATHDQNWIDRYHPNVLRLDHGRLV